MVLPKKVIKIMEAQIENIKTNKEFDDNWPVTKNWAEKVAEPCLKHNLSPHEALGVLEVCGALADCGIKVSYYMNKIYQFIRKNPRRSPLNSQIH